MLANFYVVETCAQRQLTPLNTDNQIIQDRDFSVITVNARQLTAFRPTLYPYLSEFFDVNFLTTRLIQCKSGCRSDPTSPMASTNSSKPIRIAMVNRTDPQIVDNGYNSEMNEKINAIP